MLYEYNLRSLNFDFPHQKFESCPEMAGRNFQNRDIAFRACLRTLVRQRRGSNRFDNLDRYDVNEGWMEGQERGAACENEIFKLFGIAGAAAGRANHHEAGGTARPAVVRTCPAAACCRARGAASDAAQPSRACRCRYFCRRPPTRAGARRPAACCGLRAHVAPPPRPRARNDVGTATNKHLLFISAITHFDPFMLLTLYRHTYNRLCAPTETKAVLHHPGANRPACRDERRAVPHRSRKRFTPGEPSIKPRYV